MSTLHPLAQFRADQGLTLTEMAERIGVRANTVWRWEARRQIPPSRLWSRIREATEGRVSVADFETRTAK